MTANSTYRRWMSVLTVVASAAVNATPPTFKIDQVFSNLDGSTQFIVLTETAGLNGQQHFAGLTLTSTHNGVVKQYTFPSDLPTEQTAHLSVVVGVAPSIGGIPIIFYFGVYPWGSRVFNYSPDFVFPDRFIAIDGGAIDFAGIDQLTFASLPTDGTTALFRDGTVQQAALPHRTCPGGGPCPPETRISPTPVTAIEYYSAAHDHYFITASAPDIDALDSGRFSGWQRTGEAFAVGVDTVTPLGLGLAYVGQPVCRFYIPPEEGDSHFFSASADECVVVHQRFPGFVLESNAAFYVTLPDLVTGVCPLAARSDFGSDYDIPLVSVFRLWNQRVDSNHRYTTNVFVRNLMVQRGYVGEGYGPNGVAFCVLY